jgi:hypothetical protein
MTAAAGSEGPHDELQQRVVAMCALPAALVVATSLSIWITRDGGGTWSRTSPGGDALLALACRGDEILAAGANGLALRSGDQGRQWSKVALEPLLEARVRPHLDAVHLADDGAAYLGGGSGGAPGTKTGALFVRDPR